MSTPPTEKTKFAPKSAPQTATLLPPIAIQPRDIEKFRKLWREEYGEDISTERARNEATVCLRLVQLTYHPMQPEDRSLLREKRVALANALEQEVKRIP